MGSRGYIIRRQKATTVAAQNNPDYAGVYNVAMNMTITLVLPTGVALVNPEFRVYALETVDIPAGGFYAGDGNSGLIATTAATTPLFVANENALNCVDYYGAPIVSAANFPKGTYEYFMLKYELSNEAFCEFMNTVTRSQQNLFMQPAFASASSGIHDQGASGQQQFRALVSNINNPAVFGSDANGNGTFNVWEIDQNGNPKQITND